MTSPRARHASDDPPPATNPGYACVAGLRVVVPDTWLGRPLAVWSAERTNGAWSRGPVFSLLEDAESLVDRLASEGVTAVVRPASYGHDPAITEHHARNVAMGHITALGVSSDATEHLWNRDCIGAYVFGAADGTDAIPGLVLVWVDKTDAHVWSAVEIAAGWTP